MTVSMGLTFIDPTFNNEIESIYKETDDLLYKAKQNGRNNLVY